MGGHSQDLWLGESGQNGFKTVEARVKLEYMWQVPQGRVLLDSFSIFVG